MADLNKFQRSKDQIIEMLNYLMSKTAGDETANSFVNVLEQSVKKLDLKMEDYKRRLEVGD